ncbi:hypothetical protein B0H15DRAFT_931804 [Mycena belliarum]|uniref:Uncharacterized protein n=1 Tax=Mycena belliarum TaxID=1033014 RepID=A0AAD6U2C8_9AGAR|nr:hypothetical protein B0H15DRAFT_931804 [Mycena belliae]
MTAFQWFPSLVEDPFPDVSGVLLPYKNALCNEASAILQSLPTKPTLKSQHQTIIQRQIFVLLCASAGANILQARVGIKAYEAESRHDWDALLYCFYIADEEIISRNILLERTIHYPKNLLAEKGLEGLVETVKADNRSSIHFYLQGQIVAARTAPSQLYTQALLASTQADKLAFSYGSLCETVEPADVAALEFLKYTKEEPATKQKETKTGESDSSTERGAGDAKGKTATNEVKPTKKGEGSGTGASEIDVNAANRKRFLQNPFALSKKLSLAALDAMPELEVPEFDTASCKGKLLFPHLVVEYRKRNDTEAKALDQGRMHLISLISFYAALNIVDRAFYTMIINGAKGALLMGWKSKRAERTYLFDKNVVQFDISTPSGAYQFAIFLLRLREEQKELEGLIEAELNKGKFDRDQFKKWRKESQTSDVFEAFEDPESTKTRCA